MSVGSTSPRKSLTSALGANKQRLPKAGLSFSYAGGKQTPTGAIILYGELSDCDLIVFACKTLENWIVKYMAVDKMADTLGMKA